MFCLAHSRGQVSAISNGPADCHSTGFCYGPAACCSTSLILCAFSFWCCFLSRWYSPRVKIATSHDPITGLCVLPFFYLHKTIERGWPQQRVASTESATKQIGGWDEATPRRARICLFIGRLFNASNGHKRNNRLLPTKLRKTRMWVSRRWLMNIGEQWKNKTRRPF